jgi:hypothetical protein
VSKNVGEIDKEFSDAVKMQILSIFSLLKLMKKEDEFANKTQIFTIVLVNIGLTTLKLQFITVNTNIRTASEMSICFSGGPVSEVPNCRTGDEKTFAIQRGTCRRQNPQSLPKSKNAIQSRERVNLNTAEAA